MVAATLRKVGNRYQVELPEEEITRLGLSDGQTVEVELRPAPASGELRPKVREAFEASWRRNEAGYRYLAGR